MARAAGITPPGEGRRSSAFTRPLLKRDLGDLVRLAWPVILSRVGIMTMGLTDIAVVGHYSTVQLGHQAMAWALIGVVMTASIGLISGVQVMSARHIGEGRPQATGGVFRRGVVYGLWIGLASALALTFLGPMLLHRVGMEADLADGASRVLQVLAWSLPTHVVFTVASFYMEALARPKPAMVAMWVCNGLNLVLNLLFVGGALGLPALGAVGSAWATVASRAFLAAWLLIYIYRMKDARALGLFAKPVDGPAAAAEQRKVGYGAGASYAIEAGAFHAMSFYAAWLGGLTVAAWAVILNIAAFIFMFPLGLAAATAVLVGRAYGADDRDGVVRAGGLGFGVCVAMLSVIALVVLAAPGAIGGVYTSDPQLLALVRPALALCALFYVVDGLQAVAAQALRARADVWVPTFTHMFSYLAVMIPAGWALAFPLGLGLHGLVWAVIAASFVSAGLLTARFWRLSR